MVMGWRRASVANRLVSLGGAREDARALPSSLPTAFRYAIFTRLAGGVIVLNGVVLPPVSSLYCVTGFDVVSPFALIEKLPRSPSCTFLWSRLSATFDREPPEFAIAVSMTSIACAPHAEYGFGSEPISAPKSFTNFLPAGPSFEFGCPATLMYIPSAAPPAFFHVSVNELKPSGAMSGKLLPSVPRRSLISLLPFSHSSPPR